MNMPRRADEFLPYAIEAEQALIGALLLNNDAWGAVSDIVEAEQFGEDIHRRIWAAMAQRLDAGEAVSPLTLSAALGPDAAKEIAEGVSVSQYLARMVAEALTVGASGAASYAATVRDMWCRRQMISFGAYLQDRARGGFDDAGIQALMEEADRELAAIRFGKSVDGVVTLEAALAASVDRTAKAYQGDATPGLATGIQTLDEMIGPLMPGDLITILGASGHGKSALAAQILMHNAQPLLTSEGHAGLFVSMEMDGAQIARRAMAAETGISTRKQRAGEILPAEFEHLADAARKLAPQRIVIDETPRQTTTRICRKARAIKRRYGISIMAIDHLLEILPENPRWSKVDTVEHAVREFKRLAKELGIVIVMLAQATREGQKRDHWRLRPSDIYGGDAVKQSSDIVLSLSIPSVWLKEREPDQEDSAAHAKWAKQSLAWDKRAEIGAPKVRDGESGSWRALTFDGARTVFGDR